MALTQGQIESFCLICMNQVACQYAGYVETIENGLSIADQTPIEEKFYKINSMLSVVWGYNPLDLSNCLTDAEIESICWKITQLLCITLTLETLPETMINFARDFYTPDFNYSDFA